MPFATFISMQILNEQRKCVKNKQIKNPCQDYIFACSHVSFSSAC